MLDCPPLAEDITADPLLRHLKMIAQPLDDGLLPRGGAHGFPHWGVWLERNQAFSRDILAFLAECRSHMASGLATRSGVLNSHTRLCWGPCAETIMHCC